MIYRVKEPFALDIGGVPTVMPSGFLVSEDHPAFTPGRRHLFEPVEVAAARAAGVEQATATPGELRAAPKRRGRRVHKETEAEAEDAPTSEE